MMTRLNYMSPIRLIHKVVPTMLERGAGAVGNISSVAANPPTPGAPPGAADAAAHRSAKAARVRRRRGSSTGSIEGRVAGRGPRRQRRRVVALP